MTADSNILNGSCLCGLVTYEVPDAFEYSLICHCSECRRTTGAGSKPFVAIKSECLTVAGNESILRYGSGDGYDAHCERCGSLLYSLVRAGAYVHVTMGTLNDSPTLRPSAHIFVKSKADWDVIWDNLPQFDRFPND